MTPSQSKTISTPNPSPITKINATRPEVVLPMPPRRYHEGKTGTVKLNNYRKKQEELKNNNNIRKDKELNSESDKNESDENN